MRIFKRLSIALLTAALAVTLAACVPDNGGNSSGNTGTGMNTGTTINNSGEDTNTGADNTATSESKKVSITVELDPVPVGTHYQYSAGMTYNVGDTATVSVYVGEGYIFTGWKKNGVLVSTDNEYSFIATESCTYVATFKKAEEDTGIKWTYSVNADGKTATLTGYSLLDGGIEPTGTVQLPDVIDGYTITVIGSYCLSNSSAIRVVIPDTVQEIENNAFVNTKIVELTIPANVTKVGSHVCGEINDTLDKVTLLGDAEYKDAFSNCNALKTVVIGSGVSTVSEYAFGSCDSLSSVTLRTGLTTIEERAFYSCKSLTYISFPSTLKEIGASAFSGCRLQKVVVPEGVTKIGLFAFEETDSSGTSTLKAIYLPSTLQEISNRAVYCYNKEYRSDGQPLHVYYGGSENDWNKVNIIADIANQEQYGWALSHGNTCAEMHYNASPSNVG